MNLPLAPASLLGLGPGTGEGEIGAALFRRLTPPAWGPFSRLPRIPPSTSAASVPSDSSVDLEAWFEDRELLAYQKESDREISRSLPPRPDKHQAMPVFCCGSDPQPTLEEPRQTPLEPDRGPTR